MDKMLDILTRLDRLVDIEDGFWRERMLSLIHQAMDIAVRGKAHKWPEEKPECYTWVLIKRNGFFGESQHHVAWYAKDGKFYVTGFDESADAVTHWWHLPEVKE
jgi:hypothetical protein